MFTFLLLFIQEIFCKGALEKPVQDTFAALGRKQGHTFLMIEEGLEQELEKKEWCFLKNRVLIKRND